MFTLANLHELEYFAHIPAYLIKFCICHATQIMIEQLCQMTNNCGLLQNWHGFCAEWFKNFIKHSARLYVACFFFILCHFKNFKSKFFDCITDSEENHNRKIELTLSQSMECVYFSIHIAPDSVSWYNIYTWQWAC